MVKNYDFEIIYNLGKANKVANALSRKSSASLAALAGVSAPLHAEMASFGLELVTRQLTALSISSTMFDDIKEKQDKDKEIQGIKNGM